MKKISSIIIIFLIFILIYFLQSNFFIWFNIAGIKPNLFIILVLITGLYIGKPYSVAIGIVLGLLLDLFIGKKLGMYGIQLGVAAFLGVVFNKNFSKDSRITIMLMVAGTTFICETLIYIYKVILYKSMFEIISFIKIISIEIIFNTILIIIIYPLMQKLGELLERSFNENKILTKYY